MAEIKERLEEFGREELVKISKSGEKPGRRGWGGGHHGRRPSLTGGNVPFVFSCSERDPGVHHREPDVGQEEQR